MVIPSHSLNQNSATSVSANIYPTKQPLDFALSEKLSQVKTEIHQLTEIIEQLKVPEVFQPPHRLIPLDERLDLHLQSLTSEKKRVKNLKKNQELLKFKQEELQQLEQQLSSRKIEVAQAMKRLESLADRVKKTESAYCEAIDEFQATAKIAHQALIEAYGQQASFLLDKQVFLECSAACQPLSQLAPRS